MKVLAIDRFDGVYAICVDKNKKMFAIEIQEMPSGAKKGDIIVIDDEGAITVSEERTRAAKSKNKKLEDQVWN